ncbi:MAG: D-aminoacyl-tRNA deacylase [Clostridia bacterium]
MRAVVQRVTRASVTVDGRMVGEIGSGILVLLGVGTGDETQDAEYLADRMINLRIFPDDDGRMNVSGLDAGADVLVVPQFTLYGDCSAGRRPSFVNAAAPEVARNLYREFVEALRRHPIEVATGEFGAMMDVALVNWGPVTLLLDTDGQF